MGFLTRNLGIKALSLEDPAQPLLPYSALFESLGLGKSDAGVMVNEKQAMRITTCFACIQIISQDISSLPLSVYQSNPDGSVREAKEHRLYPILHDEPNPDMTAMVFRGTMLASVLGWGNSYSLIRRDKAARVVSLHPLPSDRTQPMLIPVIDKEGKDTGKKRLIYVTTATSNGMPAYIEPENILHVRGLSSDGLIGLSPIGTCKNAFGITIAAEKFGAQFFGNGARATGVFMHPGALDAEAQENIKKSVREQMTGESALRPLILEEGMTWEQLTIPPNEAQFLQTRQFQRVEIASLYRVAMHLLQDLTRATNNNIEHQSLDHIRYTLRPWAVQIEQEINKKLLSAPFHCAHDFNDFQRGDYASQTAGLQTLRNIGVYSTNDCLKALRQNPISADEGGDLRTVQVTMVSLQNLLGAGTEDDDGGDDDTDPTEGDPEPVADRFRAPIVNSFRRLFRDAVGRVANRKDNDRDFAYRAIQPVIAGMGEAILAAYHLPGGLTEKDHEAVKSAASAFAHRSVTFTKENASPNATWEIGHAYDVLKSALIGASHEERT